MIDKTDSPVVTSPYFDIQAEMGVTKHPGGLAATRRMIDFCGIGPESYVLEIGCGTGLTTCYLAKKTGCRVLGIDISDKMLQRAYVRKMKSGLEAKIELRQADAVNLPYEADLFDVVISESVTAFAADKGVALGEYSRVLKPGGLLWLNETTWIEQPPPEVADYLSRTTGGIKPENKTTWETLLHDAGLQDLLVESGRMKTFSQIFNELRMSGIGYIPSATLRFIRLYVTSPDFRRSLREMIKESRPIPKRLLDYYGWGIYAGRKTNAGP